MSSLSFNFTTNFGSTEKRAFRNRPVGGDSDRKQSVLSCKFCRKFNYSSSHSRLCRIMACAVERNSSGAESQSSGSGSGSTDGSGSDPESSVSSSNSSSSSSSFLSRSQTYSLLKQQMEVAAKSEDYKEAARLRNSLKVLEDEEPILRLRRLLREAIQDERFEDAARYRDELKEIAPYALLRCSSDAITMGIRVQVRSVHIESRSQPSRGQYFFAYRIRITNKSDSPVQLLRRHWIITDGNGKTEHVRGVGVVGEQPVILPNTGFEYSSACPLGTPSGKMEGEFEMKHVGQLGSPTFNVVIAPFSLSTLGDGGNGL